MEAPRTIAVDFDGTICNFAFPGIGAPKEGVAQALSTLKALGFHILIYSCRTCHWHYDIFGGDPSQPVMERERVKQMIAFLDQHSIPYDEVDDGSKGKPLADYYIDDKGIRFEDNWAAIVQFIERMATWKHHS